MLRFARGLGREGKRGRTEPDAVASGSVNDRALASLDLDPHQVDFEYGQGATRHKIVIDISINYTRAAGGDARANPGARNPMAATMLPA
jgi:hypothetical protein